MTTTAHPIPSTGNTQCNRILKRLRKARGAFVPMPVLVKCSKSYVIATRVSELRKKGHTIDCEVDRTGPVAKSRYRIVE